MELIEIELLEEEWDDEDVSFCTTTATTMCAEVSEEE